MRPTVKLLTRHADNVRISDEEGFAYAFVRCMVADGSDSADDALAPSFASTAYADVGLRAGISRGADVGNALSSRERITDEALDAFARRSRCRDNALGTPAAVDSVAFCTER